MTNITFDSDYVGASSEAWDGFRKINHPHPDKRHRDEAAALHNF